MQALQPDRVLQPENRTERDANLELEAIAAQNIETSPQLLEKLSRSENQLTRRAVVQNPNTPAQVLFQLGAEFPEELLENPVFPLLCFEAINPVEILPLKTLESLLSCRQGQEQFLEAVVAHPNHYIRYRAYQALSHPNCSSYLLRKFVDNPCILIRSAIARNSGAPTAILEKLTADINYKIRRKLARNPALPLSVMEILVRDRAPSVRRTLVRHPQLPTFLLEELARDTAPPVGAEVARDAKTPIFLLEKLSQSQSQIVRQAACTNPRTPVALVTQIVKEAKESFRGKVAKYTLLPEVLSLLSRDRAVSVRLAVAENSQTPAPILKQLGADKNTEIRRCVARNVNTPPTTLASLANDSSPKIRAAVDKNKKADIELLEILATDGNSRVRAAGAENRNTPPATLERLETDISENVRSAAKYTLHWRKMSV